MQFVMRWESGQSRQLPDVQLPAITTCARSLRLGFGILRRSDASNLDELPDRGLDGHTSAYYGRKQ